MAHGRLTAILLSQPYFSLPGRLTGSSNARADMHLFRPSEPGPYRGVLRGTRGSVCDMDGMVNEAAHPIGFHIAYLFFAILIIW